jgi:DNA-directed RNA polymerase sigma subunit (sigma70/sigma32)
MSVYWPTDDGWPYPDSGPEIADLDAEYDDDMLNVRLPAGHLLDRLTPLERQVITAHYGFGGSPRTINELHTELGLPRSDLRMALGSGLAKLRSQLAG